MFLRSSYLFFLLYFGSSLTAESTIFSVEATRDVILSNAETYPVPPRNERSLFYIQRSKNTNAIVYELNLRADGRINEEEPVHVFWLRYSSDSTKAELNYIQKNYAYGIESRTMPGKPGQFVLNLVSYDKKKIFLIPGSGSNAYQAFTLINGRMALLDRIFIRLNGGTFWFPVIEEVEIKGRDPQTREVLVEYFKPESR
jgi:hypothetical protein